METTSFKFIFFASCLLAMNAVLFMPLVYFWLKQRWRMRKWARLKKSLDVETGDRHFGMQHQTNITSHHQNITHHASNGTAGKTADHGETHDEGSMKLIVASAVFSSIACSCWMLLEGLTSSHAILMCSTIIWGILLAWPLWLFSFVVRGLRCLALYTVQAHWMTTHHAIQNADDNDTSFSRTFSREVNEIPMTHHHHVTRSGSRDSFSVPFRWMDSNNTGNQQNHQNVSTNQGNHYVTDDEEDGPAVEYEPSIRRRSYAVTSSRSMFLTTHFLLFLVEQRIHSAKWMSYGVLLAVFGVHVVLSMVLQLSLIRWVRAGQLSSEESVHTLQCVAALTPEIYPAFLLNGIYLCLVLPILLWKLQKLRITCKIHMMLPSGSRRIAPAFYRNLVITYYDIYFLTIISYVSLLVGIAWFVIPGDTMQSLRINVSPMWFLLVLPNLLVHLRVCVGLHLSSMHDPIQSLIANARPSVSENRRSSHPDSLNSTTSRRGSMRSIMYDKILSELPPSVQSRLLPSSTSSTAIQTPLISSSTSGSGQSTPMAPLSHTSQYQHQQQPSTDVRKFSLAHTTPDSDEEDHARFLLPPLHTATHHDFHTALSRIMSTPILLRAFKRFCVTECNVENVLFFEDFRGYVHEVDTDRRREVVSSIVATFIQTNAPLELNLPSHLRDPFLKRARRESMSGVSMGGKSVSEEDGRGGDDYDAALRRVGVEIEYVLATYTVPRFVRWMDERQKRRQKTRTTVF